MSEMMSRRVYKSKTDYNKIANRLLYVLKQISQKLNNYNKVNKQLGEVEREIIETRLVFAKDIFTVDSTHKYAQYAKKNINNRIFISGKNWPSIKNMPKILNEVYQSQKIKLR